MKHKVLLLIFFTSLIILVGCQKDNIVQPEESNSGTVVLGFDKRKIPANANSISASLVRTSFEPITRSISTITDSTAEIKFEMVPIGKWHLKVEAWNEDNILTYEGETDVEIYPDSITVVEITLNPITGSVEVKIKWNTISYTWQDFENNPIIVSSEGSFDHAGVQQPKVYYDNNKYQMYYLGLGNSSISHVLYAESVDGLNWTKHENPVLSPSPGIAWDNTATIAGALLKDENEYKMYYVGWSNPDNNWSIGLATSNDGLIWSKRSTPVLSGTSGWEFQVIPASVMKKEGIYYLYYYGRNGNQNKIGLATSNDGINWTRFSGNPILFPTHAWEGTGITHPSVYFENGNYYMIYGNNAANGFGSAVSHNGINWTKIGSTPFFKKENTHSNWAASGMAYPHIFRNGSTLNLYYSGTTNGEYKIGLTQRL